MIAIKIILALGFLLTMWISYSLISFFYGDKIKAYFDLQIEIYKAEKHYNQIQEQNRRKSYLASLPQEVEVEDLGEGRLQWDIVKNGQRKPKEVNLILDITNNETLSRIS